MAVVVTFTIIEWLLPIDLISALQPVPMLVWLGVALLLIFFAAEKI